MIAQVALVEHTFGFALRFRPVGWRSGVKSSSQSDVLTKTAAQDTRLKRAGSGGGLVATNR